MFVCVVCIGACVMFVCMCVLSTKEVTEVWDIRQLSLGVNQSDKYQALNRGRNNTPSFSEMTFDFQLI